MWLDYPNGGSYRSVLREDTLTVVSQTVGQGPRTATWLIKGDSAYTIDLSGKMLRSVPKGVVLGPREIAEINCRQQSVRR